MRIAMRRPNHIDFDGPRSKGISPLLAIPAETITITDEERERVCNAIDKRGLWNTELPAMLGLVER